VLRSVDTLLVSIWGLHTMTSLSWLAVRAAIVSLLSNAPKLHAETKQVKIMTGKERVDRSQFFQLSILASIG